MPLLRLFRFFQGAADYASPEADAVGKAGESADRHVSQHGRIASLGGLFGALGAVLGLIFAGMAPGDPASGKGTGEVLLAPLLFGAAGCLFGAAIGCLFAPRDFLAGPLGRKWMEMIGTKNVVVARMVCLLFGLVVAAPVVGLGLLLLFAK